MGDIIVSTSKLTALADVIRLKSGKSDRMKLDEMPGRIRLLPGRISNTIDVTDLCNGGNNNNPYATNVKERAINMLKTVGMTDMSLMFKDFYSSNSITAQAADYLIDVSTLNTASVTNMSSMFEGAKGWIAGIHNWDTSNVTNMSSMFKNFAFNDNYFAQHAGGQDVKTIDLSNLDTSSVTDFSFMFSGFTFPFWVPMSKHYLDLNSFDTSSATTMKGMFSDFKVYGDANPDYQQYLWVPSTFVSTQISTNSLKPFYYNVDQVNQQVKLHVYTDATDAVSQGWGTIASGFDMHYNSTHSDFLDLVNS